MAQDDPAGIDRELTALRERARALISTCDFAGSFQLHGELRRRGRLEQRAEAYVLGTFFQMDEAQYLLDFQLMRERAIELIALLENEEKVRQIQADLPREQYDYLVYSMSSCAYENLAEATGLLEGYNSEGMHACIADGLQICRRTGKTGCISCFREYACDVYMAADDAEIAAHQCRLVRDQDQAWSDRGDRRWLATIKLAWLDALHGRFAEAVEGSAQALQLCEAESVSLPIEARLRVGLLRDTILMGAGRPPEFQDSAAFADFPARGQCPLFEHSLELNTALLATRCQDWPLAFELLTAWDQRLQKNGSTHLWLETRLRLVAAKLLAGERSQAERLAKQLEQRARVAHDYLTLRRLQVLLDADSPSPIALLVPTNRASAETPWGTGPYWHEISRDAQTADQSSDTSVSRDIASTSSDTRAASENSDSVKSPLAEEIEQLRQRSKAFSEAPCQNEFESIREEILAFEPPFVTHSDDACSLVHLMTFFVGTAEDGEHVWKWANALVAGYRDNAMALSVLGTLGDALRNTGNEVMQERVTVERTEQLHRKAMELDSQRAGIFLRAGLHFVSRDNHGEAERCFARAFRLERSDGAIARHLSELYRGTDRPKDALHVLDLCLREGSTDPQVAFDAGMLAFRLAQYDACMTYLERYEQQSGPEEWLSYYRSLCCYEQGDFQRSLEFVEREQQQCTNSGWHLEVVRSIAKARAGDLEGAKTHVQGVLKTPFYEVDYLSVTGLTELIQRLAVVAEDVLQDAQIVEFLERRLLRSGLMPDSWFQYQREHHGEAPRDNMHLYRCLVFQPLDESWLEDPDRLCEQQEWKSYLTEWGVLAGSEEEASEIALRYQSMCADLAPEVREVMVAEGGYTEAPGPVWQSGRFSADELPDMAGLLPEDFDLDDADLGDDDDDDDDERSW
ncbi:MAG: hypothetical protein RLZZ232_258 [Planctomycetota bacterium]